MHSSGQDIYLKNQLMSITPWKAGAGEQEHGSDLSRCPASGTTLRSRAGSPGSCRTPVSMGGGNRERLASYGSSIPMMSPRGLELLNATAWRWNSGYAAAAAAETQVQQRISAPNCAGNW